MKTSATAIALAFVLTAPMAATAQTAKDLVGTWKNIANVTVGADGKRTDVFGPHGTGMAIFAADGHFVVINHNPDTAKFAGGSRAKGTDAENKEAVAASIGLYGTYTMSGKTITMKVAGSTYPNWTGTEQKRDLIKFTPGEFTWGLTNSLGGRGETTWKKM